MTISLSEDEELSKNVLLYNTLTCRKEEFTPFRDGTVRMYACGLTVYARGHIGNFRTFVCLDVLRRTLRHVAGFNLRQVVNFTDVDDKTIKAARAAGVSLRDYTDQFIQAFRDDAQAVGLETVEEYPRATDEENLRAMAKTVMDLETRGHAYRSDGSVYFKISTFQNYGKLARLDHDGIKIGARIDSDQYSKHDARDFVLWKATTSDEPSWDFGLGPGRPGWHIECSAMALRLLGDLPIDIHAGGIDLVFPHHENEIAQAEGATGKSFSRFWVHVEHLLLAQGDKMSKSQGNVLTVRDVLDRGHRASALRYVLMSTHYRKQLRFSWESLEQAEESVTRLMDCVARFAAVIKVSAYPDLDARVSRARQAFAQMMLDDLNTPGAFGVVFELVRDVNTAIDAGKIGIGNVENLRAAFDYFDQVLGVLSLRRVEDTVLPVPIDEIERLIAERQDARKSRNFSVADQIRTELEARGIVLEDSSSGTRWKRG